MPLQPISRRGFGRFSLFSVLSAFAGTLIISAFIPPLPPASAETGPFAGLVGSWSGTGTLRPSNGNVERIRCQAHYRPRGSTEHEVELELRCTSDSYNFDLTGQFVADEGDRISGRWTERSRSIGGTAIGVARGDRLQIHVESPGFSANMTLLTRNRRQSVTIDSHGGGQVVKASITLRRS